MKRAVFLFAFLILIGSIASVSALDIALTKSSYYPGETLQAEFPAAPFIEPLQLADIAIYRGDSVHPAPVRSGLIKSGNKYLYYAVLPDAPENLGDYSLRIEDINHYENNAPTEETIEKNFTITQTNSSYLSFSPGNIYASADFSVKIKAYNAEQAVSVELPEANFKKSFPLGYGMEKTVYISIADVIGTVTTSIKVNTYNIPITIIGKAQNETGGEEEEDGGEGEFEDMISVYPDSIDAKVFADISTDYRITITKETSEDMEDIKISSSGDEIEINETSIDLAEDEAVFKVTINSDSDINGEITLEYNDEEIIIPVNITIIENESEFFSGTPSEGETKTCAQRSGRICNKTLNEKCSGEEVYASDYSSQGACCIGACEAEKASSGWLWGILILIILGIAGWYLYKKSKGGPGISALGDIFKKKTEAYEKRIKPEPQPSFEVRKSLSKD